MSTTSFDVTVSLPWLAPLYFFQTPPPSRPRNPELRPFPHPESPSPPPFLPTSLPSYHTLLLLSSAPPISLPAYQSPSLTLFP
eukprot:3132161-Rhodomonas_salina.1